MATDQSISQIQNQIYENPFPGTDISPAKKEKREFGRLIGKAIEARYQYYISSNDRFHKIGENRRFASNSQNPDYYKPLIDPAYSARQQGEGQTLFKGSLVNIDWDIFSPCKKFVNSVVGMIIDARHSLQYNAIDKNSRAEKEEKRRQVLAGIYMRDVLKAAKVNQNLSGEEAEMTSKEDVEIYMETTYKQRKEMAMEMLVDHNLKMNKFREYIEPQLIHDLIENNKLLGRCDFDSSGRIKIEYGDIQGYMGTETDYPTNEHTDFDAEYCLYTIAELRNHIQETEGTETYERKKEVEKILYSLAKKARGKYGNAGYFPWEFKALDYDLCYWNDFRVPCIIFNYYTIDKTVFRFKNKKGKMFVEAKDAEMKIPESKKDEYINDEEEVIYEGIYVPLANEVFGYGKQKNICRTETPKGKSWKPTRRFIYCEPNKRDGVSTSMVDDIKQLLNAIQIKSLKMRQVVAEAAPPGFMIDWSAISELFLGDEYVHPKEVIAIFKAKGITIANLRREDGTREGIPFQNMPNGIGDSLAPYMEGIAVDIGHIREITGVNDSVDGSITNPNALVGIQKMKAMSANRLLRETFNAYSLMFMKRLGETLRDMIQTQIEYDMCEDEYRDVIGDELYEELKFEADKPLPLFGVHVESLPDTDEIAAVQNFIEKGIETGTVDPLDIIDVKRITNLKMVEQKLKFRARKRKEQEQMQMQQAAEFEAQKNQSAAEARVQAENAITKFKNEADINLENVKHTNKMEELNLEITMKGANEQREINLEAGHRADQIRLANQYAKESEKEPGGSNLARTPGVIPTPPKKATSPVPTQ